jgi:hypothetical protein
MKRHFLYLLIFFTLPFSLLSQVTRTVGTTGANYSKLKLAFDAINAGTLTGNITLQIIDNTIEAGFSAQLNASGIGNANYTSVNIYPTVTGKTISGNLSNLALIYLNGADNVTIDGRLNATGSSPDLTITNTSTSAGITSTIYLINEATSNTIKYCNLKGSSTSALSGILFFSTSTNPAGNNNNTIDHNNITSDGSGRLLNAIFSLGTNGKSNIGNIISNNNIFDFLNPGTTSNGVNLSSNNSQWTISDNSFYETSPSFAPTISATYIIIYIHYGSGTGFNISGNYIGGRAAFCGGSPWTKTNAFNNQFFGIYLNAGEAIPNSIQGNIIKNFNWSNSGAADWTAIQLLAGAVNIGTSVGNTIGASSGTGSILVTGGATNSNVYGIRIASGGTVDCQNNIIGSVTASNSSLNFASNLYAIYKTSTSGNTNIINNLIGSTITSKSINASSRSINNIQSVVGIRNESAGDITISGNNICNLSNETTRATGILTGLDITSTIGLNIVSQNFIYKLLPATASTITAAIYGIRIISGYTTITNNIVNLAGNTPTSIYGIYSAGTSNETYLYHNTVDIEGSPTYGSNNTAALYSNGNLNTQNFRNNIFRNARSNNGASGKHYAIRLAGNLLTIDYNDYYITGTGGVLGYLGSDKTTLAAWKIATGQDNNSMNANPVFRNPGSTIASDYKIGATLTGVAGTGITTDFGLNLRGTPPTMGAWEKIINKWKGAFSTSWANAANWTDLIVPANDSNIIFDASPNNDCVLDQNRAVTDITNGSVRNLILAGNALTLKGNLNFTGSGRINATASGSGITYGGASSQTIEVNQFLSDSVYNLTIANIAGVSLNSNFKISHNLTINPSSIVTIEAGKYVTVTGATANSGTLNLRSTSGGTASLITGTASGSGINVERYVTGGAPITSPSHLISSPVSGQDIATFLSSSGAVMKYHDDATGLWINGSPGGNFVQGTGYAVRKTSTGVLTFTGTLNTPPVTRAIICNDQNFGWNCVGNPFASSLDISSFLLNNFSINGLLNPSYANCYVYTKGIGYTPIGNGSYLQPGQGFFVKSVNPSLGSLNFTSSMQIHQNPVFYKKSGSKITQNISLKVKTSIDSSFTYVFFMDGMSKGLDPTWDAGVYVGKPEFMLYTKLIEDNGVEFYNQYLPDNETYEMIVPVGFDYTAGGLVKFTADVTTLPVGYSAILEDRLLGTFTDMEPIGANYEVIVAAGIKGTGRFYLHSGNGPNKKSLQKQQNINTFAVKNEIFIKGQVSENAVATVFDLLGRKIGEYKLEPSDINILKVNSIKDGIYIVRVLDRGVLKTDRVYISE